MDSREGKARAVLVDLDDTIVAFDSVARPSWIEVLGALRAEWGGRPTDEALVALERRAAEYWADPDRHRRGRMNLLAARKTIIRGALRDLGLPDRGVADRTARLYESVRTARIHLLPGAVAALGAMRAAGLLVGLVTNGTKDSQGEKISRFGLEVHVDQVFIEGTLPYGKPDPRIYQHAITALGTAPETTWMIGDNWEWEVAAPRRLGLTTVWVRRDDRPLPNPAGLGDGPPVYATPSLGATLGWWDGSVPLPPPVVPARVS